MNPNRTPVIAGNWKMYKTAAEAAALPPDLRDSATACALRVRRILRFVWLRRRRIFRLLRRSKDPMFSVRGGQANTGIRSARQATSLRADAELVGHRPRDRGTGQRVALGCDPRRRLRARTGLRRRPHASRSTRLPARARGHVPRGDTGYSRSRCRIRSVRLA